MQKTLEHPNASFVFYPQEWLVSGEICVLSMAEKGRLITRIMRAVDEKDTEFLRRYSRYVGRVIYRRSDIRPSIPVGIRRAVIHRDGRACVQCGSGDRIEVDHYIPYSKGGTHTMENLRVLCKPCNRRKGAKMPETVHAG